MRKIDSVDFKNPLHINAVHENPDLLLIGFNSTRGVIEEIMKKLEEDGIQVNHVHIRMIHPFPAHEILPYVKSAKKVVVIENNATGQLANLLKMNIGHADKITKLLKYDGNPFLPYEVYTKCRELI